ncbi:MAG: hypothetical protein KC731_02180 [Myxococcales bacterium]|nr:hypothetical protein [Myxococcales bacterium]
MGTSLSATTVRVMAGCLVGGVIALATTSCETIPDPFIIECADLETFPPVSNVLEKRCGTIDCHGSFARPLRIFGRGGMRYHADANDYFDFGPDQDAGYVSGGVGTTEEEYEANWRSVCGLQPEIMTQVVRDGADPLQLLILAKPLGPDEEGGQRHKGGVLLIKGGVAYDCIKTWIEGNVDNAACAEATAEL